MPVALLVHGAAPDAMGLPFRTSELFRGWACVLAAAGLASVMLDHTLGWPDLRLEQALGEIDRVLAWLALEGEVYGADTSRLSAVISSAGGVLAPSLLDGRRPIQIHAAALFSPLLRAPPERAAPPGEDPEVVSRMSLAHHAAHIAAGGSRLFLVRAGADAPLMLQGFDLAVEALLSADAEVRVRNIPWAPHAFEAVVEAPWVSAVIDEAVRFLAE
jgi:acetyl esterase/lipase